MHLSLSLNGKVTLLALMLLPLLMWLGNWQLQRAEEKRAIAANFAQRQEQEPVALEQLDATDSLAFTPLELRGRFHESHQFLLDNRVLAGQLGYEVLTPFLAESGQWALVNRGWIKGNPDRSRLPEIPSVKGVGHTQGSVYVPPGDPFLLSEQHFEKVQWPLVVQAVEMDKFSRALNRDFFPYVIRLRGGAPGALRVDWQTVNVQPGKHTAYAVQWFAMALALVTWLVFANTNLWQVLRAFARHRRETKDFP